MVLALFSFALVSQRRLSAPPAAQTPGRLPTLTDVERCMEQAGFRARISCYRPILEAHLAARGPRAVLADFDRLQAEHPVYRAHCHDMAHILGRYWIGQGGSVAEGFREGLNVCHSGFFHGMVERVLRGDEVLDAELVHASPEELQANVARVCTLDALGTASRNLQFQCLHGLGHAVVFSLSYQLPAALATCDVLPDDWTRRSCYGGAFMENITGVERDRRMLRAGDPHYPCTVVDEKYREACYIMQTSWMLEMGMGWDAIVAACRAAGPHRLPCFQSFGRDLSPRARTEGPAAYARRCTALREDERLRCAQGAVFALADHTWDGRYVYPFCAVFTTEPLRARCFEEAHAHLLGRLEQPRGELAGDCRTYAATTPECLSTLAAARPG